MNSVLERRQPATVSDWERVPEGVRAELIDGTLFLAPGPAWGHQRVSTALTAELFTLFDGSPGVDRRWFIAAAPTLQLTPGRIVIPDVAGWRVERFPEGFAPAPRLTAPPDWVAEIRSASTATFDTLRKGPVYRQAGVAWYWIIDPDEGTVEAFRGEGLEWVEAGAASFADRAARLPPFEDGLLDVQRWFSGIQR